MSQTPSTTPAAAASATTNPLYNPTLPTDRALLHQTLRPAPDATALCAPCIPSASALPNLTFPRTATTTSPSSSPSPTTNPSRRSRANVLLVIPTANASKTALLTAHLAATRPPHVAALTHLQIPAESGVGEQPYDEAGPRGAFNRVLGAVRALRAEERYARVLGERGVGTVVVGAVENFVRRERERNADGGVVVPVDYGVVVFCRILLGEGEEEAEWEWRVGVSRGVTVPVEYWRAAEGFGFEDEGRMHGKVTVGEVMAANLGVDKANWFLELASVSRYDLLGDAMKAMEVPWPVAGDEPAVVV